MQHRLWIFPCSLLSVLEVRLWECPWTRLWMLYLLKRDKRLIITGEFLWILNLKFFCVPCEMVASVAGILRISAVMPLNSCSREPGLNKLALNMFYFGTWYHMRLKHLPCVFSMLAICASIAPNVFCSASLCSTHCWLILFDRLSSEWAIRKAILVKIED